MAGKNAGGKDLGALLRDLCVRWHDQAAAKRSVWLNRDRFGPPSSLDAHATRLDSCADELEAVLASVERTIAQYEAERIETVSLLRSVCAVFGDNDWADSLHLADVIDKHLRRHLEATADPEEVMRSEPDQCPPVSGSATAGVTHPATNTSHADLIRRLHARAWQEDIDEDGAPIELTRAEMRSLIALLREAADALEQKGEPSA